MARKSWLALAGASLILSGLASHALALQVSPMVTFAEPSGAKSSYRLSVKNTEATPITVEIQVYQMSVDAKGDRKLVEDQNDLLVFPPQSIIPPGREQLVQIRYIGDPKLTAPKMYLIRAAQLPIKASGAEEASKINANVLVAFNISTHLFVEPPGAKPAIEVAGAKLAPNGDALITIHNRGDGIAPLRDARYVVAGGGRSIEIAPEDVDLGVVSALPPGDTRVAKVPAKLLKGLSGEVTATVQLQ